MWQPRRLPVKLALLPLTFRNDHLKHMYTPLPPTPQTLPSRPSTSVKQQQITNTQRKLAQTTRKRIGSRDWQSRGRSGFRICPVHGLWLFPWCALGSSAHFSGDIILQLEARMAAAALGDRPPTVRHNVPRKRNHLPPCLSAENKDISTPAVLCLSPLIYKPTPGPVPAQRNAMC